MFLIAILIAITGLQLWGAANPLHKDAWFDRWSDVIRAMAGINSLPKVKLVITLFVPTLVVGLIAYYIRHIWLLWVVFAAAVLLYSLGRGRFMELFLNYLEAARIQNWDRALRYGQFLGVPDSDFAPNDWAALNTQLLIRVVYRAFERLFVVLFWFVLFGPAGALLYRLSYLYKKAEMEQGDESGSNSAADLIYWLWVIEWPAARVFAISFALTGNFVGCLERAKTLLACANSPTEKILNEAVLGALSLDSHDSVVDVGIRELDSMHKLLNRTLWLWVLILALISLF